MKNIMANVKNINVDQIKSHKKKIIAVIGILTIWVLYKYYSNKIKWDKLNPIFFKSSTSAKKENIITPDKFYESRKDKEYTFFYWMYVDNLIYNYGKRKQVFVKGIPDYNSRQQSPGVYISPKKNSIEVIISTIYTNDSFIIDDFPIRKWFSVAIVVKNKQVELYIDGRLKITRNLSGIVKLNTGSLEITKDGGYDGLISSISYFPEAKTRTFINVKHSRGPFTVWWVKRYVEYIKSLFMQLKSRVNIKVDLSIDLDKPTYKKLKNKVPKKENTTTMKNLGKITHKEALKICNENDKCNSLIYIHKDKSYSMANTTNVTDLDKNPLLDAYIKVGGNSIFKDTANLFTGKSKKQKKKQKKKQLSKAKKIFK
tara:strand:- start:1513 stop:2622 length:1110 start_codon:yes stop_codon:yes gene_type:complete